MKKQELEAISKLASVLEDCAKTIKEVYGKEKTKQKVEIEFEYNEQQQPSMEKILEECKRRYPVGTRFKSVFDGCERIVRNGLFISYKYNAIMDHSEKGGNYVYYNGKFAEILPYEPKKGDFVYFETDTGNETFCCVFDKKEDGKVYFYSCISINKEVRDKFEYGSWYGSGIIRPATEAEKQMLLDALHAQGKDWDAEKMEVVDYFPRAEKSDNYWCLSSCGNRLRTTDYRDNIDNYHYETGNYSLTEEGLDKFEAHIKSFRK